jgi:hypothetical protein
MELGGGWDPVGDFNGDGFDDIVYQHWGCRILYGGNRMDTIPDWRISRSFGFVHPANINGDQYGDIVTSLNNPDYIYLGSEHPDTNYAIVIQPPNSSQIGVLQDINGDGFDDLCFSRTDSAYLLTGGSQIDTVVDYRLWFPCPGTGPLGASGIGDVNADGYNDFAMWEEECEDSWFGTLTIYLGHPWINPLPVFTIIGRTAPLNLSSVQSAVGLGDVNNDGVDDFAVSTYTGRIFLGERGRVIIVSGDRNWQAPVTEPSVSVPSSFEASVYPNPFNSCTTISLTVPPYSRHVDVTIYNILGQEIYRQAIDHTLSVITIPIDATQWSSGMYLLQTKVGEAQRTQKLMLLK